MTITIVLINPQTENWTGVCMMSCSEEMVLRIWGFWKKSQLRLDHGGRQLSFCHWGIELSFLSLQRWLSFLGLDWRRWIEILNITRRAACGVESDSMVSISFKELCLFPRITMNRSQKLINRSYLKQHSLPVFAFAYVLHYCCDWYYYGYTTLHCTFIFTFFAQLFLKRRIFTHHPIEYE